MSHEADASIEGRKADHLRIAREQPVEVPAPLVPGGPAAPGAWVGVELVYQALPEIDLAEVDTSVTFLGKRLSLPLLIGSMTGGTDEAATINRRLAEAAQRTGIAMGLGSQRVMLERPGSAVTFAVRDVASDVLLLANVGAVQLNLGVEPEQVRALADAVGADAVTLHLNAAQEAVQPEGDTQFAGLTDKLRAAIPRIGLPTGVKEVGHGFSERAAKQLATLPLAWIETAGRGGTSWTLIEGMRASAPAGQALGALFADWGVHTVTSLANVMRAAAGVPVVASGGVRTGLDAAKAIALGADLAAMALPLLKAAEHGVDEVVAEIRAFERALRTAMFLTGSRSLADLRRAPRRVHPSLLTGETR